MSASCAKTAKICAGLCDEISFLSDEDGKELRDKLREKEVPRDCIENAVERLKEIGYLNDREFADLYAQELLQKYGRRIAVQKLMQKGVPRRIAEEAAEDIGQEESVVDGYVARLKQKYRNEDPGKAKQKDDTCADGQRI